MSFSQDVARLRRKLLAKGFTLKPTDKPLRVPDAQPPHGLQAALFDPRARQRLEAAGAELADIRTSLKTSLTCACGASTHAPDPSAPPTHCPLCGTDFDSPESQLARALVVFGRCVGCGVLPRSGPEGFCVECDPPPAPEPPLWDVEDNRPFLPEDE